MTTVPQLCQTLQTVLGPMAERMGRESGFVQRRSKMNGAMFVQTLVFGWLADPQASLDTLCGTAVDLGLDITPQGLDARFSAKAAECLQGVLQQAVQQVVRSQPLAIPLLQRFSAVHLIDSTQISLPPRLARVWPGCGGHEPTAALKVHARLDLLQGGLGLSLHAGRSSDRNSPYQSEALPAGALRLSDLGFFDLERLAAISAQDSYWLSRPQAGTKWFTADAQSLDLVRFLQRQTAAAVDVPVQLGATERLRCRLMAWRVPAAVARKRRARLHTQARKAQQPVSRERLRLADWTVYVTNVPTARLSLVEAQVMARVRWQIELLFKLWKSHGEIDSSQSEKPWRMLCEVYAKLLGQVVQHWVLLVTHWAAPNRSWVKAARIIRHQAGALASAFSHADPERLADVLHRLHRILARRARINKRRREPHTFQLLLALTSPAA